MVGLPASVLFYTWRGYCFLKAPLFNLDEGVVVYQDNFYINGFNLGYISDSTLNTGSVVIEFNKSNIEALENCDEDFFTAIRHVFAESGFISARNKINDFLCWHRRDDTQGIASTLFNIRSFSAQKEVYDAAELIINLDRDDISGDLKSMAKTIIHILNDEFVYKAKVKTPEEKAKSSYERRKPKIRVKLVIRDGYKCVDCGHNEEDSLCITQKEKDALNFKIDNLHLKCRRCLRKK